MEAQTCHLTPLAPRVDFEVPATTQRLILAAAPGQQDHSSFLITSAAGNVRVRPGESWLAAGDKSRRIQLVHETTSQLAEQPRAPRTPASLILRRLLTEGRDRFLPA